jgi:hypothetical protein
VPGQYRTSLRTIRPIAPTFVIGEQPESHGPPIIAASFSNTGWQGMMFAFEHPPLVVSANVADYDQNEIHYSRLMVSTLIESRSPQGVEMDTRLEMDSSRLQKYSGRSEGDALADSLRLKPLGAEQKDFDLSSWDLRWIIKSGGHAGDVAFRFALFYASIVKHQLAGGAWVNDVMLQFTWSTHWVVNSVYVQMDFLNQAGRPIYNKPIPFPSVSFDCDPYSDVYSKSVRLPSNDYDIIVKARPTFPDEVSGTWCAG